MLSARFRPIVPRPITPNRAPLMTFHHLRQCPLERMVARPDPQVLDEERGQRSRLRARPRVRSPTALRSPPTRRTCGSSPAGGGDRRAGQRHPGNRLPRGRRPESRSSPGRPTPTRCCIQRGEQRRRGAVGRLDAQVRERGQPRALHLGQVEELRHQRAPARQPRPAHVTERGAIDRFSCAHCHAGSGGSASRMTRSASLTRSPSTSHRPAAPPDHRGQARQAQRRDRVVDEVGPAGR